MIVSSEAIQAVSPWKSGNGLRLRAVDYRPGGVQARHRHDEPSLSLVLAGSLVETSAEGTFPAVAGCLVIKPAGCWHANNYGPRGARVVQILPTVGVCGDEPSWGYGWQETPRLMRYVLGLLQNQTQADEVVESTFWDTLSRMLPAEQSAEIGAPPHWWPAALELLDAAAEQPASIAEIARQIGVHPVHLARVVRRRLGCSVRNYLCQRRTLHAWRACERSDDSLAAIASRAGFADQAHMTRAFREVLGISPARLRRLGRPTC